MNPMTDIWTIFGRDQGQTVERAYRYHPGSDRIIRREVDRSDMRVAYSAAACPDDIEWSGSEGVPPWYPRELDWTPLTLTRAQVESMAF